MDLHLQEQFSVLDQEDEDTVQQAFCPSPPPPHSGNQMVLGFMLQLGIQVAEVNPVREAPSHPPNQTGRRHVQTYGSVDERHA
jgi:hypothetical protein